MLYPRRPSLLDPKMLPETNEYFTFAITTLDSDSTVRLNKNISISFIIDQKSHFHIV